MSWGWKIGFHQKLVIFSIKLYQRLPGLIREVESHQTSQQILGGKKAQDRQECQSARESGELLGHVASQVEFRDRNGRPGHWTHRGPFPKYGYSYKLYKATF